MEGREPRCEINSAARAAADGLPVPSAPSSGDRLPFSPPAGSPVRYFSGNPVMICAGTTTTTTTTTRRNSLSVARLDDGQWSARTNCEASS